MKQQVKENDCVTVNYEGLLSTGEVFESSTETGPLRFQVGKNEVLPVFERSIIGMSAGETKTVQAEPQEAYGPRNPELIHTVDRQALGPGIDPKPGTVLGLNVERDGAPHKVPALVTEVQGDKITVDFNHPLAGHTVTYHITLQSIDPGKTAEPTGCGCTGGCDTRADDSCSPSGCNGCGS